MMVLHVMSEEFVVARPKIKPLHTGHSVGRWNCELEVAIRIANVPVEHGALGNVVLIAPDTERRRVDEPRVRSSLDTYIDVDPVEFTEFRRRFPLNKKRYQA